MMKEMHWSRSLFLIFASCLLAQTPSKTIPIQIPGVKIPPGQPQPSVTLSEVDPGPMLNTLPPDKVVLTVGEDKVTAAQLDAMIDSLPESYRAAARGNGRREFAANIARLKAMSQEARRRGIDKTPGFQFQLAFQTENMLASLLIQDFLKTLPADEAAARANYEKHKEEFERVSARHILIRFKSAPVPVRPGQSDITEQEALAKAQVLRKKLQGGADFATIAQAESDDTVSAAKGGDLGSFGHGQMAPSFEEAAFKLPVGEVSQPVLSRYGYHLILVEKKEAKPFEEVKADMEKAVRSDTVKKAVEDLRQKTKTTLDPAYYGETK